MGNGAGLQSTDIGTRWVLGHGGPYWYEVPTSPIWPITIVNIAEGCIWKLLRE